MKQLWLTASILLAVWLAAAGCAQSAAPATTSTPKTSGTTAAGQKAGWEQDWETVVAEGKKEGSVIIYGTWRPGQRDALAPAFKQKYGINLEFSPAGRGSEMVAKSKSEQNAGLYLVDFFGGGSTTAINLLKPVGLLGPMEPMLILPEVTDPKNWMGGQFPFLDKEKQFIALLAAKQPYITYNTELVKKGEITSYKDLLKPQYKGKITINDPSTSGSGAAMMTHLAFDLWSMDEAKDFLTRLIKDQGAYIERDNRLHVETVARGKFAVALGTSPDDIAPILDAGAPIDVVIVKEGTNVSSAAGGIAAPTKLPHPNASKVFLNWLLTREGLGLFAKSFGAQSMRTDVPTDGINPLFVIQPGEKLFMNTEEKSLRMGDMTEICKKIISEASR